MSTELNITIDQGETWIKRITWQDSDGQPYDLTGHTARMMVRRNYADMDKNPPVVSLDEADGIELGDSDDNIVITIADTITETIRGGVYYWDLELVDSSNVVTKLLRGKVIVLAEVTR